MDRLKRYFLIVSLLLCPIAAMAQDGSALSNLFRRNPGGGTATVRIDTPNTAIPRPTEVPNATRVTVTGTKSPVDKCTVATTREELPPEPNPLGQLVKILTGIPGAASVDRTACASAVDGPNDSARRINSALDSLQRNVNASGQELGTIQDDYKETGNKVSRFVACRGANNSDICSDPAVFVAERDTIRADLARVLASRLPVIESIELQLASVKKLLAEYLKTSNPNPTQAEQAWLDNVNLRLDCLGKHIAFLRQTIESLKTSRSELERFADLLETHTAVFNTNARLTTYSRVLPEDNNAKVSGTVTCTNFFTKQVSVDPIPFTVTYHDIPFASVTMGVLFTTLNKREIGTSPVRTGTAADGTPTFRNTFAETDRAANQIVPFSFFNVYLSGTRRLNLNFTGGVGINPNNGSNQAEFFVGGALGFKNLYVQFGGHIGRWQELGGGFVLGETVPADFPGVPIERRYTMRPSIGISYRLPLP
jgi:hypothetical protein